MLRYRFLLLCLGLLFVQCKEKPPEILVDLTKTEKDFFSTPQDIAGLYGTLQPLAQDQGISIARFKAEPHQKTRYYEECPVSMELEGDYPGLATLLLSISKRTPLLIIGKTDLRGAVSARPGHTVKASLSFSAFLPAKPAKSEDPSAGPNAVREVRERRFNAVRSLNEVQSSLPTELWITGIQIDGAEVQVHGSSKQEKAIPGFIAGLKDSKQLASVELKDIRSPAGRNTAARITTFSIVCGLQKSALTDFAYTKDRPRNIFVSQPSGYMY